ncbi:glycerol-3-phosphate dehydrogenase/oxidase [Bacillus fonticola]|uniref:glycerol-3-phosphate dehydrogenase/oxidase n=1 Tax=Bacillus fonticola TaxID=2728853 RepID=UPI001474EC54|nr:glycerol-3-phosphate dehydrogenase/oxidase [Bacillus fonticola]
MTTHTFSSLDRSDGIRKLQQTKYDLIIVGGGITGAGIALDAASRGLKVALVEMQDFAAGTSSRSTKLVHGGLRYLKQFQIGVVAEVGKERAIVYENGPHVTTPEWMLLPIYKDGTFGKFSTSIGLRVYDFLAGVVKKERRKMLSVKQTLEKEPLLKRDGLVGGGHYVEYRTDDARLTIEVLKKAVEFGTTALNYTKVTAFQYDENKRVQGIEVADQLTGETYAISGSIVVNAAGPWVDQLREMDRSKTGKVLKLSKGVHIVLDKSVFPLQQAVYFDTPDGRMIFAIPRNGKTYVGTTDTFYDGNITNPKMTEADRTYLLEAIDRQFPDVQVTAEDVESSWAGVRPLIYEEGKNASEISRKDEIWTSPSGLITIAGGKLTGYRKMAETVVDVVSNQLDKKVESKTKTLPISGGDIGGSEKLSDFVAKKARQSLTYGFTEEEGNMLAKWYGSNVDEVFRYSKRVDELQLKISKVTGAQLLYAIYHENAVTPVDFLYRRTSKALFRHADSIEEKEEVIQVMSKVLQWSEDEKMKYAKELETELHDTVRGE